MSGKRRTGKVGRWSLTVQRWQATRTRYTSGGQRTPGPWWSLTVRWLGEITLGHDRTLFGWSDEANKIERQ